MVTALVAFIYHVPECTLYNYSSWLDIECCLSQLYLTNWSAKYQIETIALFGTV